MICVGLAIFVLSMQEYRHGVRQVPSKTALLEFMVVHMGLMIAGITVTALCHVMQWLSCAWIMLPIAVGMVVSEPETSVRFAEWEDSLELVWGMNLLLAVALAGINVYV